MRKSFLYIILVCFIFIYSCKEETPTPVGMEGVEIVDLTDIPYQPEEYIPETNPLFPKLEVPDDNLLTIDGVQLGRHLFFDPIMSVDSTKSCASCHNPELSYTDGTVFSEGVAGAIGTRSAMSLINVGYYNTGLFWDGRSPDLEEQAIHPVEEVNELANNWENLINKLRIHSDYPTMFRKAFGIQNTSEINQDLATKALAQFQRILISADSKFDKVLSDPDVIFTSGEFGQSNELAGENMFFDRNDLLPDAECAHCHAAQLFTDNSYRNNGLDPSEDLTDFADLGRGEVTGNIFDNGKFRVPTLRNVLLTAPYMHDGRFKTIEEVIDHYSSGGHPSLSRDQIVYALNLTDEHKQFLIDFLHTLTDTSYLENEIFLSPFN